MQDIIAYHAKMKFRRKLRALWKSRTAMMGSLVGGIIASQPYLMAWLSYKLTPADYALAGLIVFWLILFFRWITNQPLEEK